MAIQEIPGQKLYFNLATSPPINKFTLNLARDVMSFVNLLYVNNCSLASADSLYLNSYI